MTQRVYAWIPDVSDHRDLYYSSSSTRGLKLPTHVDPLGRDNPIEDQGQLGSCTGQASTTALEIVLDCDPLSRLFAYYNARVIEDTVDIDAGAMIRDVIKAFIKHGCCNESSWEYDASKFATKPIDYCYEESQELKPKINRYERITTLKDVKFALSQGLPVIFGFAVPEYFETEDYSDGHVVRLPLMTDAIVGGHAVVAVGYDDRIKDNKFIWVKNSWGSNWGESGYFKMDQNWFTDGRRLVDDLWVIHPNK